MDRGIRGLNLSKGAAVPYAQASGNPDPALGATTALFALKALSERLV